MKIDLSGYVIYNQLSKQFIGIDSGTGYPYVTDIVASAKVYYQLDSASSDLSTAKQLVKNGDGFQIMKRTFMQLEPISDDYSVAYAEYIAAKERLARFN